MVLVSVDHSNWVSKNNVMTFNDTVLRNQDEIAFIVGNGIHRYPNNPKAISWDDLLIHLWGKFSRESFSQVPKGITITEFYDLLDIENSNGRATNFSIQKEVCDLMKDWVYRDHHVKFMTKAREVNAPVLTTNFDLILAQSLQLEQYYTETKGFSDFYPWTTYFGTNQLIYPTDGFGLWFINGFTKYHRSIRLGLSHYMGSVEKARNFLHKGDERKLFSGKNQHNWRGSKTWMHVIFNKSLCLFGIGMEENEVFLRWLLIERAKYFKKFPERKKKGWYITKKSLAENENHKGKKYFLKNIGFEIIEVEDYSRIYETPWV